MDYLLADPISVPESNRDHFSETIWYLPDTRLCFTPPAASAKLTPTPPPAERNGFITFGCFQNVSKITGDMLTLWGKIFHALPQARLRLQSKQMYGTAAREHLLQRLDQAGIARQRVEIQEPMTREDYLAAHAEVDIILDTFPFPGGTTTCEALWMGVPTVTLAGNTMLARQGASLLTCAGLAGWVANTEEDYVALAVAHASDVKKLAQLRAELRQKVLASPLYDASRFALNLEDALYGMWQHSHSLNSPAHHV
jgi:protein O-GlcNAc transferase